MTVTDNNGTTATVTHTAAYVPDHGWEPVVGLVPGPRGAIGIIGALADAAASIGAVGKDNLHRGTPKDGEANTGTWNYRSADAVVTAAGPAMAAQGVIVLPTVAGDTPFQIGKLNAIRLAMRYTFLHRDGSAIVVDVVAHAVGNTAYTIGAAYSYAFKYALSQTLAIPFDDPRMDQESNTADAEQRRAIEAAEREAATPWWSKIGYGSEEAHGTRRQGILRVMRELPPEHMRAAKRWLAQQVVEVPTENGVGMRTLELWVPTEEGKPDGPGVLVATIPSATADQVDAYLGKLWESAAVEADGGDPFEVEVGDDVAELAGRPPTEGNEPPAADPVAEAAAFAEAHGGTVDDLVVPTIDELITVGTQKGIADATKGKIVRRTQILAHANTYLAPTTKYQSLDALVADTPAAQRYYEHLWGLDDLAAIQ